MNLRAIKRRHQERTAIRNATRWEMRRWSRIVLRLSPGVTLRPELLD